MNTPVFEFTMMAKDPANPIARLTVRVIGLDRRVALTLIKDKFGNEYDELYTIAGPRILD